MKVSEQAISKKGVHDLVDVIGDDKELRRQMVEVLRMELLGSRNYKGKESHAQFDPMSKLRIVS